MRWIAILLLAMSALAQNPWVLMVPAFLLVISIIVFIHEMGHYLVGRWSGIRVLAFSFGFGPELLGFTDKHGTRWKISAVPLGGYVRFYGDEDASSKPDFDILDEIPPEERAKTFLGAKLWKRAATVAAGGFSNNTCLPAAMHWAARSRRGPGGVHSATASRPGTFCNMSAIVAKLGTPSG